jgi:hypothetical protein
MPDSESRPEEWMQPARREFTRDSGLAEPKVPQLSPHNHPMLPPGEFRHPEPLPASAVPFVRYAELRNSGAEFPPWLSGFTSAKTL